MIHVMPAVPLLSWPLRLYEPRMEVQGVWVPVFRNSFNWETGMTCQDHENTLPRPWIVEVTKHTKEIVSIEASRAEAFTILIDTVWPAEGVDKVTIYTPSDKAKVFDLHTIHMPVRRVKSVFDACYLTPHPHHVFFHAPCKWRFFPDETSFFKEGDIRYTASIASNGYIRSWTTNNRSEVCGITESL